MTTNNDPTIIVLQQNMDDEGEDEEEGGDDDIPEEDKNDDSDSVDRTPGNPLLDNNTVTDRGGQDMVLSDSNETQGEITRLKVLRSMKRV